MNHLIGLFGRGGVEYRDFSVFPEMPGVLFCLGGDGPGIVGHYHHHAALDGQIIQAHQRIGGHVQAYLFHGDHGAGAGIGGTCGYLQGCFFVDRPFNVNIAGVFPGDGFQNFSGRGSGIA